MSYSSVIVTPGNVKVKGDPKVLNELDSITVFALDGSEVEKQTVNFASVLLPGGIEVVNAPATIEITAKCIKENTEVTVVPGTEENTPEVTSTPDEERALFNE